ncbi:hypothetical protein Pmar_PMAR025731, partial [Perkinsus marinus ATCC 50983]
MDRGVDEIVKNSETSSNGEIIDVENGVSFRIGVPRA